MKQFLFNKNETSLTLGLICLGVILGVILIYFPGTIFILVLTLLVTFVIWRILPLEDRPFLFKLFAVGMLLRIMLYFILGFLSILQGNSGWIIGDSQGVHSNAWIFAQYAQGSEILYYEVHSEGKLGVLSKVPDPPPVYSGDKSSSTVFLGIIYYLFGPMKFSARILYCLMGVISGLFIYYVAKEIFGKRVAKLAAILTIFLPSLVLWSITFLKDTPYIFVSCIVLWSFLKYRKTKKIFYLFIFFLAILNQNSIRYTIPLIFIMLPLFLSYFIVSGISWRKKTAILVCMLIIMVPLLPRINIINKVSNKMVKSLNYTRGVVYTGGTVYKVFDAKYYRGGSMSHSNHISFIDFTRGFFRGWAYFLLLPFPWITYTGLQLISYPQVILWYLFIPFIFIGMITALRYKWRETFIIFTYIFFIGSMIAITGGNIGTVFRHRDMLTPLFLIFGSLGLIKIFGKLDNFK